MDILILKDKKIKVIIEIEEANIKPTQICGKFLTSALSRFFIHKTQKEPIEMDKDVLFVQILDISKLDHKSAKPCQWKRIEKSLNEIIPVKNSLIKKYNIFYGTKGDFDININSEGKKLVEEINNFICN